MGRKGKEPKFHLRKALSQAIARPMLSQGQNFDCDDNTHTTFSIFLQVSLHQKLKTTSHRPKEGEKIEKEKVTWVGADKNAR